MKIKSLQSPKIKSSSLTKQSLISPYQSPKTSRQAPLKTKYFSLLTDEEEYYFAVEAN